VNSEDPEQRLFAAWRAQGRSALPTSMLLALATALGATAGVLAGLISAWPG
jgi:hypothetical protein